MVALLAVWPAVSATVMVKPVVTVPPGATWWAVGEKTSWSRAAVTTVGVPTIRIVPDTEVLPSVAALGSDRVPLAGLVWVMVTVSVWPALRSVTRTAGKGVIVALSLSVWLMAVPVIVGGTAMAVAMTLVVALLAVWPAVSATVIVKPVVTVPPGATWWAVGEKISWSREAVTAEAEPVTV